MTETYESAKEVAAKASRRIKWTSGIIALFGMITFCGSIYKGFNSRDMAEKLIFPPGQERSQTVSRDEFDLYDTFNSMATIAFLMAMPLMGIAGLGFSTAWWGTWYCNYNRAKGRMMKALLCLVVLMGLSYCMHCRKESIKPLMDKYAPQDPHHHHDEPRNLQNLEDLLEGLPHSEDISAPQAPKDDTPTPPRDEEHDHHDHHDDHHDHHDHHEHEDHDHHHPPPPPPHSGKGECCFCSVLSALVFLVHFFLLYKQLGTLKKVEGLKPQE